MHHPLSPDDQARQANSPGEQRACGPTGHETRQAGCGLSRVPAKSIHMHDTVLYSTLATKCKLQLPLQEPDSHDGITLKEQAPFHGYSKERRITVHSDDHRQPAL